MSMLSDMKLLLAAGLMLSMSVTSCVTRQKFDDLNAKKSALEVENAECSEKLAAAVADRERLSELAGDLNKKCQKLIDDTTQTGDSYRRLKSNFRDVSQSYEKLMENHDKFKSMTSAEKDKLSQDLARREKELYEAEKKNRELTESLKERENRVKELEKVLEDKDEAVNELKNKVSKALLSFKEKDLSVNVKNGKVYVSLSEQLLFKSGSTSIDSKGQEALKTLAEVLKDQDDVNVMVEGHTDDVPVGKSSGAIKDNWDLSVLRATEISRILINAGVSPRKIVPSGRGEFSPVAEGKTKEARQQNRRTEIILTPRLDELFQILENN
ncbi:OmpA family protein [Cytophagaceae bacterium ABcell3]|nr:OmpA family protein [Cytophagaceae bacterium ABcell3]